MLDPDSTAAATTSLCPAADESPVGRITDDIARLTFAKSLPIILGLILLLSICGAAAYLALASRAQVVESLQITHISNTASALRADVLGAESSQRGYLFTQRAAYRIPFQVAVADTGRQEARLADLVAGDGVQVALAKRITGLIAQKITEMQRTLTMSDAGQIEAAKALVNTDVGLKLMDEIMGDLAALRHDVAQDRTALLNVQTTSNTLLVIAVGFAAAGALLMALLAMLQVRDHLRQLHRREQQLDQMVTSLEGRVAQRTTALAEANQRFQIALNSSEITVFHQDRDLRYGWISRDMPDMAAAEIIGKTDAAIYPPTAIATLERFKRGALATGQSARMEVRVDHASGTRWYDLSVVPTLDANGKVEGLVGGSVDISDRKQHEAHVRLLLREITHRSKNLLAVIQAIMRQTMSHAISTADFTKRFSARLDALAGSLDLLVREDWHAVTLADLVRSQLAHHADPGSSQIELDGGTLKLPPDAAQNIGMALHELATNASKYGALSVPEGRVRVSWNTSTHTDGTELCWLRWEERGGPLVGAPARRGFGQVVIERTVARAVGGKVTLSYPSTGVQWTLEFPLQAEGVEQAA